MTATTTSGQPLAEDSLHRVLNAADMIQKLDVDKTKILELVKRRMHQIAPNLSTVVGEEIAARLMGVAGGLRNLSQMPACNVQVPDSGLWGSSLATGKLSMGLSAGGMARRCWAPSERI